MTTKDYNQSISNLAASIKDAVKTRGLHISSIYGIPRGGYYAAIRLSQALNLPIALDWDEVNADTLIVDDICDTGKTLSKYTNYSTAAVVVKKRSTVTPDFCGLMVENDDWVTFPDEKGESVEDNIRRIFEYIGENPDRTGLQGTPDRMRRMFAEIFRGYDPSKKPKITTFPNGEDGLVYDNMVVDEGKYYSCCEHHAMPFFGNYWFAYIPNPKGRILGISKVGRVVDYCAAKLQVQERLTRDIVDMLLEALGSDYPPLGIALVMKGTHLCKTMRGARKDGTMTTSYLIGAFKEDNALRAEFMNFVNGNKR